MPPAPVVTDLRVHLERPTKSDFDCSRDDDPGAQDWYRMDKDLCLHRGKLKAYLYLKIKDQAELTAEDWVVTDIKTGLLRPADSPWMKRDGGVSVRREKFTVGVDQVVTAVDVVFGEDVEDPRPQWVTLQSPLRLRAHVDSPSARLTFLRGRGQPFPEIAPELRLSESDGFKIVQISDLHLRTGFGTCQDAMERDGTTLGPIRADQETLRLVEEILESERPNLVVLTGDQIHHDVDDSQSAIFKAVTPMIVRRIPWTVIFGNHDDEGRHVSSRESPLSSQPGWKEHI
ncbi:purple acid phosphatase [Didymella heteroderae]|uniref:Purple acid phosphatase n=1 Tax=Didymella heteroderae TaxID=1769908 RepID=A0A9P5BUB9_9PLEO|nr:purple acid phosphatase [Didymella heteroderae]